MTSGVGKLAAAKDEIVHVVVETPLGSAAKLAFHPKTGLFRLKKVLPRGATFPFNFGFIPQTLAPDGDPLDVLLLLEHPLPTGTFLDARLIGVIEAEQTEDGETERNDRILAVATASREHERVRDIADLSDALLDEIERFFSNYHAQFGGRFKPLDRKGARTAYRLLDEAVASAR